MRDEKFMPFATDEEHKEFLENFESRTGKKIDMKEGSNELTERVRFIEKVIERMSDDLRGLKTKDRLLRLKDETEKLAKSKKVEERKDEWIFCPVCDVGIRPDKKNICPSCGSVYKDGKWSNLGSDEYINSNEIGKRSCPRCGKVQDWDEVKISSSFFADYDSKKCSICKEKAFIRTAKGWLSMTDKIVKIEKEDDFLGIDLEDVIDRYEKKQGAKKGDKTGEEDGFSL